MKEKRISARSLSALAFALGISPAAYAAPKVDIQNLDLSEESKLTREQYDEIVSLRQTAEGTWGGSGSYISSGNYSSYVSSGNYASYISSGNYADYISSGNYAGYISAGNYARVNVGDAMADGVPLPHTEPKDI